MARLSRDASGRLTLDLDREYPSRDADAAAVKRALVVRFDAEFGERWEDPLGDAAVVKFVCGGAAFVLGWDHWVGLHVISMEATGDALLERIAGHFDDHPPPLVEQAE